MCIYIYIYMYRIYIYIYIYTIHTVLLVAGYLPVCSIAERNTAW